MFQAPSVGQVAPPTEEVAASTRPGGKRMFALAGSPNSGPQPNKRQSMTTRSCWIEFESKATRSPSGTRMPTDSTKSAIESAKATPEWIFQTFGP